MGHYDYLWLWYIYDYFEDPEINDYETDDKNYINFKVKYDELHYFEIYNKFSKFRIITVYINIIY